MLVTPLGKIIISIDGKPTEYTAVPFIYKRPPVSLQPIDGCFRIRIDAKNATSVSCTIELNNPDITNTGASGERYLNSEFIFGSTILHIGAEDENPCFDTARLLNGIEYHIKLPIDEVVFGVAWATDYHKFDVRTELAADPTVFFKEDLDERAKYF